VKFKLGTGSDIISIPFLYFFLFNGAAYQVDRQPGGSWKGQGRAGLGHLLGLLTFCISAKS